MDEHLRHAKRVGDRARVLPACAAEGGQHVAGDVVAALDGNPLDRVRHVRHRNLQEAGRHLLAATPVADRRLDPPRQGGESFTRDLGIERLVALLTEHPREVTGLDPAQHDVGIGDRQRAAAPVGRWAGIRPGGIGPHPVAAAVEVQHRPASGGHGMNAQHRRPNPHPGHFGLVLPLELTRIMGHVGRGAAHVETYDLAETSGVGGTRHPDDAAGRPGEDGVLAAEPARVGEAAVGLHEQQPDARQLAGHLIHISPQNG